MCDKYYWNIFGTNSHNSRQQLLFYYLYINFVSLDFISPYIFLAHNFYILQRNILGWALPRGRNSSLTCMGHYEIKSPVYKNFTEKNKCHTH